MAVQVASRDGVGKGRPVSIIGAGFSGLVSAFYLNRAGFNVTVSEASGRAGGLISTIRTEQGLVETAANGLLNSALVEDLFSTIGLEIIPTLKESSKRYIFRNGRARRWPLGLISTLRIFLLVLRYLFSRRTLAPRGGESVQNWARRVMGREASAYTVEAALQGIYAGDPARMSASLIFGRLFSPQGSARANRKPAIRGTVSAPEGMGQLVSHLQQYLEAQGVKFEFGEARTIASAPSHPTIVATSSEAAARVLAQVSPRRAQLLSQVELLPIMTTTVFFRDTDPHSQGFGCLFPPIEKKPMLGVLKNNFIFANRAFEGYSENWIMGGASTVLPHVIERSDEEILNIITEERKIVFQGKSAPFAHKITRWPKALPHYTVELENALPQLQGLENNVALIGNYLGQIGLAKILERAEKLPQEIAASGQWTA